MRPIAVTGLGIVSPIGIGRQDFWEALCAGRSGIRARPNVAAGLPRLAAALPTFAARDFIRSPHLRRADPVSRTIVAAARLALADAQLTPESIGPERLGITVGSVLGDINESVEYLRRLFTKGAALVSPMMFPNLVLNAAASYTAMELGCTGANLTVSQGELSGEQAIAVGCDLIRAQRADVVLAGGGDTLSDVVTATYRRFRALSGQRGGTEWSSPYDAHRNGVVLGEGGAMLVLESTDAARARGATIYAEIVDHCSFGVAAPPYAWPRRAAAAAPRLRAFLERTLPAPAGVDLVCGSANSSRRLDGCEVDLLTRVFGEAAAGVALTSIKGAIGEFGAAGALTAVAACLAVHHRVVPPLCNFRRPDDGAPFRFAQRTAESRRIEQALILGIARGGATVAMHVRRAGE